MAVYGNTLRPDGVVMVNGSAVFLNTSRDFLRGLDLIYDEADGFVGYRWTGNASGPWRRERRGRPSPT